MWCLAVCALLGPVAFVVYVAGRPVPAVPVVAVVPPVSVVDDPPPDYASWATEIGVRADIPPRAVLAYAAVEVRLGSELPSCGLNWATLAGVASVESDHGRYDNPQRMAGTLPFCRTTRRRLTTALC